MGKCKNPNCDNGTIPHERDSSMFQLCPDCHRQGEEEESTDPTPVSAREVKSVTDMINELQEWAFKIKNTKRAKANLLMNAAYALKQMTDRLYKYEGHDQERVM